MSSHTRLLACLILLLSGCGNYSARAEEEAAAGNLAEAAKLFWRAALDSSCPERGAHLLRRADIQEEAGFSSVSLATIDQAIKACPSLPDGYWARAQRHHAAGDRELALADARVAKEHLSVAQEFYSEIATELETERAIQDHARLLIRGLSSSLDPTKTSQALAGRDPARLARQVPTPLALRYQVKQRVLRPKRFELAWEEVVSYRGDPAQPGFNIVQRLELPPMDSHLPLYHRLQLANRRLPMVFEIGGRGEVLNARWKQQGPNRGMRPELLKSEVEAVLKRRRLFDPGESGERTPGEKWRGETIRIIDGKPLPLTYDSQALGWVETAGVRTLHIRSQLQGSGYLGEEDRWLHPETSVAVRWRLNATFSVETPTENVSWTEEVEAHLTSAAGSN